MQYGHNNEPLAQQLYQKHLCKHHQPLAPVTKTGFHINLKIRLHKVGMHILNINPQVNWIGALPDGLVTDPSEQQANNGLVEIKCPTSAKNTSLIDLCAKSNICLQCTATGMELKK